VADQYGRGDAAAGGLEEVSLEEILNLYSQPINEEQAWAVCYQCCRTLAQRHRRRCSKAAATAVSGVRRIQGPGDVMIGRDGAVELHFEESTGKKTNLVFSGETTLHPLDSAYLFLSQSTQSLIFDVLQNSPRCVCVCCDCSTEMACVTY
uniref:KIND domain-containing protein n=1 Tax=Cynoglossus semilaevis TaxID=244447 RepID=A0A3P8WPV8_CYNSE